MTPPSPNLKPNLDTAGERWVYPDTAVNGE